MQPHDPGPRRTVRLLLALLGLVACVVLAVLWLLRPTPLHAQDAGRAAEPGLARLQTAPQPDLAAYRAQKRAQLDAVGPAAGSPGFARIPIDSAMALMAQRGLRARATAAEAAR